MSKRVDLSIVIPNFNSGNHIERTLKSIFSKNIDYDFELLVIDNLSIDKPTDYLINYPLDKVFFYSELDNGIYEAMNKGIRLAKGNWIIFLGAGDELIVDGVNQINFRQLGDFKLIYANTFLLKSEKIYDGEFDLFKLMKRNISHQAIFYHHSVFKEKGVFDTNYRVTADYVFNLQIFISSIESIKYFPFMVSRFMGGGVSDLVRDDLFQNNKLLIMNKLVLKSFNWRSFCSLINYDLYYLKKYIQFKIG